MIVNKVEICGVNTSKLRCFPTKNERTFLAIQKGDKAPGKNLSTEI